MDKPFFETISKGQEVFLLAPDFDTQDYDFDNSLPRFTRATVKKVIKSDPCPLYRGIVLEYSDGLHKQEKQWDIIDNKEPGEWLMTCNVYEDKHFHAICKTTDAVRECYNRIISKRLENIEDLLKNNEEQRKIFLNQQEYYKQMMTCPIIDESKGENEGKSV